MLDDFKLGCILLAGYAQSFWDSLNAVEQWLAFLAGMCLLGAFVGWIAGKIGRRIRARRERKKLESDVRYATILRMHYSPVDEFGGGCRVASRYVPVTGFDYQGQADMWLEQCQRAYWPSEEEWMSIKVLSVRHPWAELIVKGIKTIENREWTTNYRGPVLIHAGKQFDVDARDYIQSRLSSADLQRFAVRKQAYDCGGIVGIARLVDVVTESESDWFTGTYGWVFEKARPLSFIPMRGQLGLFDAPAEIVAKVRAEIERERGVA